jgi:hypothetical protein
MRLVDTNPLVDVVQCGPLLAKCSIGQPPAQTQIDQLTINALICAERSQGPLSLRRDLPPGQPGRAVCSREG